MGITKDQLEQVLASLKQDPQKKQQVVETLANTMAPPTAASAQAQHVPDGQGGVISTNPMPMPPTTPEEVEDNRSQWEKFIDDLGDPRSDSSALVQTGLALMQPVQPGQTETGHIAGALAGGITQLRNNRVQREQLDQQAQMSKDISALRQAQTTQTGAQTENIQGRTGSIEFEDEFTKAQTAYTKAKTKLLGMEAKQAAGGRKPIAAEVEAHEQHLLDIAWYNAHPGKFTDLEDAKVDRYKFETTNGKPALVGAIESLLENAPVWKKERIMPILDMVKQEVANVEQRPKAPRQIAKERLDALTPQDWARVASDPATRQQLESAFGADEIARRLQAAGVQ